MKKAIPLLLSILFALALAGNELSNVSSKQVTEKIKLYYGTIGSNDYIWGTTSLNNPTKAWLFHSEMPERLMDNACATNGTHVYVVSGYNTSIPTRFIRHAVGGTTWEGLAAVPTNISNGGCAIIGDTLYYCSGYNNVSVTTVDTLFKYSISGNNWIGAPGPFTGTTYNWQPLVLACQGKVYYISGCNQPGATAPTTQVWAYTPGSGWAQVASMNQGRVFACGWVYHDTIWVTGGNANGIALSHSEFYDPVANVWTVNNSIFPQLPAGVWGAASGVVGNTGFVFSGVNPAGALRDTTNYFDHNTNTWSTTPSVLLKVYRGTGVGNADNKAVIYGGSLGAFTPTDTCQYEAFGGVLDHDVALNQILAPGSTIPSAPLAPRAEIKNFGTYSEYDIPVECWIDSAGTRVYEQSYTYPGPLAPNATAQVTFSPDWTPGGDGATYQVTMFTDLSGDENHANDTAHRTTVVQIAPSFGTVLGTWTLTGISGQYALAGITYRSDSNRYYVACMQPNRVYSFSPNNPTGTLRNENWTIHLFYGNDVIWGIAWDPVTEGFWLTQIEGNYFNCKAARYVDGVWAGTPADSWELWSVEPANWFGGTDYNYDRGYFWNTKVGGTNRFYKLDLHNKTSRGYAPGPGTSYRANSYFGHGYNFLVSGGWNQAQIIKLDTLGNIITQASLTGLADCDICEPTSPDPESVIVAYCTESDPNNTLVKVSMGLTWSSVGIESEPDKPTNSNLTINTTTNPVTDRAIISFSLPVRSSVKIDVFDVTGRAIRNLANSIYESGNHSVSWDGKDESKHRVANGIYFYTLETPEHSITRKLILMK